MVTDKLKHIPKKVWVGAIGGGLIIGVALRMRRKKAEAEGASFDSEEVGSPTVGYDAGAIQGSEDPRVSPGGNTYLVPPSQGALPSSPYSGLGDFSDPYNGLIGGIPGPVGPQGPPGPAANEGSDTSIDDLPTSIANHTTAKKNAATAKKTGKKPAIKSKHQKTSSHATRTNHKKKPAKHDSHPSGHSGQRVSQTVTVNIDGKKKVHAVTGGGAPKRPHPAVAHKPAQKKVSSSSGSRSPVVQSKPNPAPKQPAHAPSKGHAAPVKKKKK